MTKLATIHEDRRSSALDTVNLSGLAGPYPASASSFFASALFLAASPMPGSFTSSFSDEAPDPVRLGEHHPAQASRRPWRPAWM